MFTGPTGIHCPNSEGAQFDGLNEVGHMLTKATGKSARRLPHEQGLEDVPKR